MTTDLMERPQSNATDIAVPAPESSAIAPVVAERDPYAGIASTRVTKEQEAILLRQSDVNELDILPTGEIYMSQVEYRRRLNAAFGPGGWALRPLGKPTVVGNTLMQEWALCAEARFISSAWGEAEYQPRNARHSYATATEALKSNALMRCCKDLGIAAECWDRRFTAKFKADHCVKVWREKGGKDKSGEYQWRRKDAEPFYDESKGKRGKRMEQAPDDVDTAMGEVREQPQAASREESWAGPFIDAKQVRALINAGTESGWKGPDFAKWLKEQGYGEWSQIPAADYSSVLAVMQCGSGGGE